MKKLPRALVSLPREGLNVLRVYPGHLLGKTWSRPISVNLLLTSRCNSKCETCDSWKLTDHDRELTLDDYRRLARETAELGAPIVTIGGGEPLLRSDLWEIIMAFKEAGRVVQLTTNGLALREPQRRKLYSSFLDRVTLSVDSHLPEIYAKVRGVDLLPSLLDTLKELLHERPKRLEVDTNTVLCRDNADTFLDTIDFLIGLGIPKINFSALTTAHENYLMTESKAALGEIPAETIQKIVNGLLDRKKRTSVIPASTDFIRGLPKYYKEPGKIVYPCFAGHLTLDVWQDGSVHGCGNLPSFANVRELSLKDIWFGAAARENRDRMARGKCPNCYLSCKIELAIAGNPLRLPRFILDRVRHLS